MPEAPIEALKPMNRVQKLMADMTLAEKLGQLTMASSHHAVTGSIIAGDSTSAIRAGAIGNLLNLFGPAPVHEMQRLAVEESRLGIPLLIGFDVIHGHRTVFPVPLGEAATFDPRVWELTAREAARVAEKELILKVLSRTHWNRKRAAQQLQISYKALLYKLRQMGLDGSDTL